MADPNMVGPRHDDAFGELPPSLPPDMYVPGAHTARCALCPDGKWIYVSLSPVVAARALAWHHQHSHTADELRRLGAEFVAAQNP